WVGSVDAIAEQRVEALGAEPAAETDGQLDVLSELRRASRDRGDAAVRSAKVAGEEVQADERDAGVTYCRLEGVELGLGHGRGLPRPPELDRVEAGGLRGRGAFEHRQLLEDQRAVDRVSGHTGHGVLLVRRGVRLVVGGCKSARVTATNGASG